MKTNMMQHLVSIIVPIYNTKPHLLQPCVDSILNQTSENIEIILVNDGSTDTNTNLLLKEYEERDQRIVYIIKENGGVTSARKKGIEVSSGEYIFFVDSDDTLMPDAIKRCYEKAVETNADIVIGNYINEWKNISVKRKNYLRGSSIYDIEKSLLMFECHFMLWGKLYRKEIFTQNQLFIPKHITFKEDEIATFQLVSYARKIVLIDEFLCKYIQNESSVCYNMSKKELDSILFIMKWSEDFFSKNFEYKKIENELAYYNLRNWICFLSNKGRCDDPEVLHLVYKKYLKNDFARKKTSMLNLLLIRKEQYAFLKPFYNFYSKKLKPIIKKNTFTTFD